MPECHKCPHNGKGHPACLTCVGPPETNHKGRTHISIDAGQDGQTLGEVLAATTYIESDEKNTESETMDVARRVVHAFVALNLQEFALVQRLMHGQTMASVGEEDGITRAAVSSRVKRLVAKHPVFAFLRLDVRRVHGKKSDP